MNVLTFDYNPSSNVIDEHIIFRLLRNSFNSLKNGINDQYTIEEA